ncbi:hypothetical protein S7335_531 [Synechococcus sp. PCC 7335]|uniref:hypothetical protein n=1 Tax=Synechococcus sp. (strain ATCC 29403 / PCC 7335) TaxID=91464 RepID=UPI00017EB901|nr:hypothetical protein [Synechococcus sp. PCC 7335]EDX83351.1 hypothetical protein S7335_531 [Synechococcus sp. PCC 7335]
MNPSDWIIQHRFVDLHTPWLRLIGEYITDDKEQALQYWHIEKADSVVVLPIHRQHILLPMPVYRPGIGKATWDFPGGRVPDNHSPRTVIPSILQRELGIEPTTMSHLIPLNSVGWPVNSAFSNQHLYGFVAMLDSFAEIDSALIDQRIPATQSGVQKLREQLTCLQCRAVLLEWWTNQ